MVELQSSTPFDDAHVQGSTVIALGGLISLLADFIFLGAMVMVGYRIMRNHPARLMSRSHIAAYIASYFIADIFKSTAIVLNFKWVAARAVSVGSACTAQGVLMVLGNVGISFWFLVIAVHMFNLLFWRWESTRIVCLSTLFGVWAITAVLVVIGPAALQDMKIGSFYGIANSYCWITSSYASARVTVEYLWMFVTAFLGLTLYVLIYLRVRGNLYMDEDVLRFRWLKNDQWKRINRAFIDTHTTQVVNRVVWYPVAHIAMMLPMLISRLVEMAQPSGKFPFPVTVVTELIFSLSGLVVAIVFYLCNRVIPDSMDLPSFVIPQKEVSSDPTEVTPYILPPPPPPPPASILPPISPPEDRSIDQRASSMGVPSGPSGSRPRLTVQAVPKPYTVSPFGATPISTKAPEGPRWGPKKKWHGPKLSITQVEDSDLSSGEQESEAEAKRLEVVLERV